MQEGCGVKDGHSLCLLLCTFNAISLRRSVGDLLVPNAAFLSRWACSIASNLSLSRPLPVMGASLGRRGDSCFGVIASAGGESRVGRKLSESSLRKVHWWKGENGSGTNSSGEAREMEISGTGERASMLTRRTAGGRGLLACKKKHRRRGRPAPVNT